MMRIIWPFVVALLGLVVLTGCGDDDDTGTVDPTRQATATEASGDSTNGAEDPTDAPVQGDDVERARLEAEATDLCPPEFAESCVASYVSTGLSGLPGLLCADYDTGTWFMETPGEGIEIGQECDSDSTHTVVGLVNYDQ